MAKIKIEVLRKYNALIASLLALLGFSSACDLNRVEYGSPHADFIVKGKVQTEENSSGIPNIKVIMGYDSTYTDSEGNYQIKNEDFPLDQSFLLEFKDVDGTINGEFVSLDTIVEFKDPEFTGGDGNWYNGKTEKELNINLKSKE